MPRKFFWIAVVVPAFLSTGCGLVPKTGSCTCAEPACLADAETAECEAIGAGMIPGGRLSAGEEVHCRFCGSRLGIPLLTPSILLPHSIRFWGHGPYDGTPAPVESAPTPAVWTRFHPVPTRPVFEPDPAPIRAELITAPPPARVD
jgi:hypothetical protein